MSTPAPSSPPASPPQLTLARELHTFGAVMLGLGAMLGTGVFVSIGVAAGVAGPHVVWAILLAACVAVCNALSSAQLAAAHPVSGGTYEYGHLYLSPQLGFTAGWMFLCAKSASAATAALGFAGYLLHTLPPIPFLTAPLASTLAAFAATGLVLAGIKRTHNVNLIIVSITILSLLIFIVFSTIGAAPLPADLSELVPEPVRAPAFNLSGFLQGCALMFVAYTGYGRIATLGEEVHHPRQTIPRAIIITMAISALLYVAVGLAAISAVGAETLSAMTQRDAAPLESVLRQLGHSAAARWVALGAMTAMLGVFLNLILGLSRVLLAMGRRGEMPRVFARIHQGIPRPAIFGIALLILALIWIGDIRLTWSFSAFTVLVYYAITNLAALRLPSDKRRYSPIFSVLGLAACLLLAFQVDPPVWATGLGILLIGLIWQKCFTTRFPPPRGPGGHTGTSQGSRVDVPKTPPLKTNVP